MSFTRRTFLAGAGSGLGLLVLTACTDPEPTPRPTASPTPSNGVPAPARVVRSSWSTDQFARGSHSFAAVGSTPEHRETLAEPLQNRVFFAGEATSVDAPGTVLGARASGARVAAQVINAAQRTERIAVIGAGAAGAEAARTLTSYGFDVVVVEARDRIGGRIYTANSSNWPVPVELGSWLLREAADASVIGRLAELGLGTKAVDSTILRAENADLKSESAIAPAAVDAAVAWAANGSHDVSLDEALLDSGEGEKAESATSDDISGALLLEQYLSTLATVTGADATQLSSWYGVPALPVLGETSVAVTGGLDAIVADDLDGVETFLATTVLGINYDDDGVSLRLGTGESLSIDRVVVTVPLGVLKDDGIEFDPLLPFAHRTAIAALGFGTVDTVWMLFDEPFWDTDATAWKLLGTDDAITDWLNLEPILGQPILVGLVGGAAALELSELDDTEFAQRAVASLAPFVAA
jgi:monoamine oxidase